MGARDYVNQRSSQINKGKTDVLTAIDELHTVQRTVLELRQKVQVERLREVNTSLASAMEENVGQLLVLERAFEDVVSAVEGLPPAFAQVDAAEKRLEAALPSTTVNQPSSS